MTEIRCVKCNRLLMKVENGAHGLIEIKCPKCTKSKPRLYSLEDYTSDGLLVRRMKTERLTLVDIANEKAKSLGYQTKFQGISHLIDKMPLLAFCK